MANSKTNVKAAKPKTATQRPIEKESPSVSVSKEIDPTQLVVVRSGFPGTLVYCSPRTGEKFRWDGLGSEQEMELRELRTAKNAHKNYFAQNWFMFNDDWIPEYLGVSQYYRNAISIDEIDNVFKMTPAEIRNLVETLSAGQRQCLALRATELIRNNEIDSIKVVEALKESLGIILIEG